MDAEADHVGWPQTNEREVMRKLIIIAGAVAALAAPSAALAASPTVDGWTFEDNTTYDQSNVIGQSDAQIIHNGWSVGGNKHQLADDSVWYGADQTTSPGSRADLVQAALGH
jgi:hypothetical protein